MEGRGKEIVMEDGGEGRRGEREEGRELDRENKGTHLRIHPGILPLHIPIARHSLQLLPINTYPSPHQRLATEKTKLAFVSEYRTVGGTEMFEQVLAVDREQGMCFNGVGT